VAATFAAFIEQEQKESLAAAVEMLQREINTTGLAVV
jgi:hypothetical protein